MEREQSAESKSLLLVARGQSQKRGQKGHKSQRSVWTETGQCLLDMTVHYELSRRDCQHKTCIRSTQSNIPS